MQLNLKVAEIETQTVWRWIRQGKLKASQLGECGSYRISKDDLEAFKKTKQAS